MPFESEITFRLPLPDKVDDWISPSVSFKTCSKEVRLNKIKNRVVIILIKCIVNILIVIELDKRKILLSNCKDIRGIGIYKLMKVVPLYQYKVGEPPELIR